MKIISGGRRAVRRGRETASERERVSEIGGTERQREREREREREGERDSQCVCVCVCFKFGLLCAVLKSQRSSCFVASWARKLSSHVCHASNLDLNVRPRNYEP